MLRPCVALALLALVACRSDASTGAPEGPAASAPARAPSDPPVAPIEPAATASPPAAAPASTVTAAAPPDRTVGLLVRRGRPEGPLPYLVVEPALA